MNKQILSLLVLLFATYVYAGHNGPLREGICHDYYIINVSVLPSTSPNAGKRPNSGVCGSVG